jgi:hypothetical protein
MPGDPSTKDALRADRKSASKNRPAFIAIASGRVSAQLENDKFMGKWEVGEESCGCRE